MSHAEILKMERSRIIDQLRDAKQNKAKLLTALIDIDDEIERLNESNH